MPNPYKIALAGCGKMGSAMVYAWLSNNIVDEIIILDPHPIAQSLLDDARVTYSSDQSIFMQNLADCDMLVIAIKPQLMDDFCAALKPALPEKMPVLSIAAGRTIASFQRHFGSEHPVIRAMPNTPAAIGKGMTVAAPATAVTAPQKQMAQDLLESCGHFEWADDESWLDAVTAVSGSGPAYVFYLIESMAAAGTKAGLPAAFAMTLARQTIIGSAALAENDPATPADILRTNVTSPNGTTAAALSVLMDGRFQEIIDTAIARATARSKELSR